MNERELADELLKNHFTATAALIALMLKNLPEEVRTRVMDAMRNGTGRVEPRAPSCHWLPRQVSRQRRSLSHFGRATARRATPATWYP